MTTPNQLREALAPCPFCGTDPMYHDQRDQPTKVSCRNVNCAIWRKWMDEGDWQDRAALSAPPPSGVVADLPEFEGLSLIDVATRLLEQYATAVDIAGRSEGKDRESWLDDARHYKAACGFFNWIMEQELLAHPAPVQEGAQDRVAHLERLIADLRQYDHASEGFDWMSKEGAYRLQRYRDAKKLLYREVEDTEEK